MGICRLLVGNKCDLPNSKRVVTQEEGLELAQELGVPFMETSARHAHNIEHTFDLLCREIMTVVAPRRAPAEPTGVNLSPGIRSIGTVVGWVLSNDFSVFSLMMQCDLTQLYSEF